MNLTIDPQHLVRLAYPNASEQELAAYALDEERFMTAFSDDK